MASEAQRLIGISLTKIAQSRQNRGGVSLHKNLLVATVLQKARYIFMEEAYNNMVHYQVPVQQLRPVPVQERDEQLVAATAEDVGVAAEADRCAKCAVNRNKENVAPNELTYLDLDKNVHCLKRRRAVSEWETEEAVQSILPKKTRREDDHHLDDATTLADTASRDQESNSMEIDRITSLVSIFSFSMTDNGGKLNRSVSTPDLCATQAKDAADSIQRPFIAMTV